MNTSIDIPIASLAGITNRYRSFLCIVVLAAESDELLWLEGSYIERLPERTPSAELIDCETLQNQYNSSFPAARITIHSISGKNSYTICVGFLWPNVILGSSSLHVNTPLWNVNPFICPGRLEIYLFLFLKLNSDVRVLAFLTRAMDKVNSRWHSINQKLIEIDRGKVVANG